MTNHFSNIKVKDIKVVANIKVTYNQYNDFKTSKKMNRDSEIFQNYEKKMHMSSWL